MRGRKESDIMTAIEAVALFKSENFKTSGEWYRFSKRYYTRNAQTIINHIAKEYGVRNKKDIKAALLAEMKTALNALNISN